MSADSVTVRLRQVADYQFDTEFGGSVAALRTDEPPPLGQGAGPSPMQLLCAAVGNCLSDSLLFALRKFKQTPEPITTEVTAEIGRNDEGRLRVLGMRASITLGAPADTVDHLPRVLDQFEAFCTVTQSVRQGFPVTVSVFDAHGVQLK